jgi:steroid delta-isomerase-like uncharacterized protein
VNDGADVVRARYDIFNRADWDAWLDLFEPTFNVHHASAGGVSGRDNYIEGVRGYRESFPDATVEIHRILADGDLVAAEFTSRATFVNEFIGIPPTGCAWELPGMGSYRMNHEKLAEAWFVEDFTGWLAGLHAPGTGQ